MNSNKIDTKSKVFIFHLTVTAIVIGILAFITFVIWYPAPLTHTANITDIFLLMAGISFILGPCLTAFIYKKGKKTLKSDLWIISIIQCISILFAFYYIAIGRPAWLVQINDRVVVITPSMALNEENVSITNDFQKHDWGKPKFVSVEFSKNIEVRNKQIDDDASNQGIVFQPSVYHNFNPTQASKYAKPISGLYKYNSKDKVDAVVSDADTQWLGLRGADNADDLVVLLNNNGEVEKIVNLRPW